MKLKTASDATAANVARVAAETHRTTAVDASWSKANACSVKEQANSQSANPTHPSNKVEPTGISLTYRFLDTGVGLTLQKARTVLLYLRLCAIISHCVHYLFRLKTL